MVRSGGHVQVGDVTETDHGFGVCPDGLEVDLGTEVVVALKIEPQLLDDGQRLFVAHLRLL